MKGTIGNINIPISRNQNKSSTKIYSETSPYSFVIFEYGP
jgi:hypothetical protein